MRKQIKTRPLAIVEAQPRAAYKFDAKETFERMLSRKIERASEAMADFRTRFDKNPADAFSWSSGVFELAGELQAAKNLTDNYHHLMKGDDYVAPAFKDVLGKLRAWLYDEVVRRAKWPEHSTSQQSNLMSLALNAARAEWLEKISDLIKEIEEEEKKS